MKSATIPNRKRGCWTSVAPLAIARSHCPSVNWGGRIYVFGGGGPAFKSLNSVAIFDPHDNGWTSGTDMPTRRSGAVALAYGDAIYVIGGGYKQEDGTFKFLRTTEIYHPLEDRWEQGPELLQPHDYPAGVVLGGHRYVLGGHHPAATQAGPKTDPGFNFCERLAPDTGRWEEIAPLPTPRFALAAVALNGRILTLGGVAFTPHGFTNFAHIETYDPGDGRWNRDTLTLPWSAAGLGACLLGGEPFIFGGYSGEGIRDHAACYDSTNKSWRLLPPMPFPLAAMGVAAIGNTVYLIGGWAEDGRTPLDTVTTFTSENE